MFSKKSHGDVKKSSQKVLDPKKDTVTRLKHLKVVLDTCDVNECRHFFEVNYSHIYYVFHDVFISVEADLKQRANKAHREELDSVLFIFEKILVLLPDLIHKRWQYHSIGRLMKKLLHTGNSLKLRREGMRLFLIWYQILMDNATEECHLAYANLIPKFGTDMAMDIDIFTVRSSPDSAVNAVEIAPMLPLQPGEKQPQNLCKVMLEALLTFMVSEVTKVEWSTRDMHEYSFNFLFNKFKQYYLLHIFPDFNTATSIFSPNLDLPGPRKEEKVEGPVRRQTIGLCQEVVVRWMAAFTHTSKRRDHSATTGEKELADDVPTERHPESPAPEPPGSNTSTLSTASAYSEKDSANSSICSDSHGHSSSEYEIVQYILYSNPENINIVHEVFRQAFLMPFNHAGAIRRVVNVYKDWLQQEQQRPVFMQESEGSSQDLDSTDNIPKQEPKENLSGNAWSLPDFHPRSRNDSYTQAVSDSSFDSSKCVNIRAGLQKTLQLFITNAANVFLLEPSSDALLLEEQVDMCKRVLNIYRYMVMNHMLEQKTWEQLLLTLLGVTQGVLRVTPPDRRERTLGGRLAQPLFQTLIVTWIKANLNVYISTELWDKLLQVLSSLTQWEELIREWAKTMDTLTRVLARQVYGLDLHDLPLDRLTEQKEKRRRGLKRNQGAPDDKEQHLDLSRQRSHSGEPSPVISKHTLSPENSQIGRSSSDSNLHDLVKKLESTPEAIAEEDKDDIGEVLAAALGDDEDSPSDILHESLTSLSYSLLEGRESSDSTATSSVHSRLVTSDPGEGASYPYGSQSYYQYSQHHRNISDSALQPLIDTAVMHGGRLQSTLSEPSLAANVQNDINGTAVMETSVQSDQSAQNMSSGLPSDQSAHTISSSFQSGQFSDNTSLGNVDDCEGTSMTVSLMSTYGDNASMASTDSAYMHMPYTILESNADSVSIDQTSLDKSDMDILLQDSQSETPIINETKSDSPSPECVHDTDHDMEHDEIMNRAGTKDFTPDRESIAMDMEQDQEMDSQGQLSTISEDGRSVLSGGILQGWTTEVAVVLWRRMLGVLGDVNKISDPQIHASVYEYLCDLLDTLIKMNSNIGVSTDNQSSPCPPELLPPVMAFTTWLFEALNLAGRFKHGKLLSYRLLCNSTVRRFNMEIPENHIALFYTVLHHGLVHSDQDEINTLVRHCGPYFFSMGLPGSTLLLLDFIHAANTITSSPELRQAPRAEAVSILGSLLCFPNHFGEISVLQPNSVDLTVMHCNDVKDHLISMLLKSGKKESAGLARCVAISSLGIFLYEELTHNSNHARIKEAINVLLATLRFNNKTVAQVAADMLLMLTDHVDVLLQNQPDLPHKIIEDICNTVSTLLPSTELSNAEEDKRLLVTAMFCLLEWCMRVPVDLMLKTHGAHRCLLYKTFKVLNMVVTGTQGTLTPRTNLPVNEFLSPEDDLDNLRDGLSNSPKTPVSDNLPEYETYNRAGSDRQTDSRSVIKLAARTVMCQLMDRLGHFPMGWGAAQVNSTVQEFHDLPDVQSGEFTSELFTSPNVQVFALNNSTLISCVEIPAVLDLPGGGVTAGLTTANTVNRVIIRDVIGKFCWESSILYGPPDSRAGSFPSDEEPLINLLNQVNNPFAEEDLLDQQGEPQFGVVTCRNPGDLPLYEDSHDEGDSVDHLLQYVGFTSPECLLRPGEPLNIPAHSPEELQGEVENLFLHAVRDQRSAEKEYYSQHKHDNSMMAKALEPISSQQSTSPFKLSRLLLNQLGFLTWGKRPHFDRLLKSDKLIRELKNLDKQRCRETHKIAVIYVAEGQEDKNSVLCNKSGSQAYEDFVSGLGWEVDLETHPGFMGGLQSNKSTGATAPYYATCTSEVIYHVSTRMPSDTAEDKHKKLRHLGNDEVHVVWSEHTRDYRRGIIPTEFGDVLIVIHPLPDGLFRIHIDRKPEVPFFGPLFDGAIVGHKVLPGLVRATAINASKISRMRPLYHVYEERLHNLEEILRNHKESTTFEDFAASVFAPVLPQDDPLDTEQYQSFNKKLSLKNKKSQAHKQPVHSSAESPSASPNTASKNRKS